MPAAAPAPDYETLLTPEDDIEAACRAVLRDVTQVAAFTQRETEDLPKERVDVQCVLGQETGHDGVNRAGEMVRDAWFFELLFNVVTPRFVAGLDDQPKAVDPALHRRMRGKVRKAMQYFAGHFTEERLPFHVVQKLEHQESEPQINVGDDVDLSAIRYRGTVCVRNGAWPLVE